MKARSLKYFLVKIKILEYHLEISVEHHITHTLSTKAENHKEPIL